ncbi:MAG: NTP transferase domain-containing protein [Desulfobacterales bacterium]|nr:NTP transferase domain-containing protein [Desulfobacterales bacterium]
MQDVAAIILAAGKGTRMKSNRAKVLHDIAGVPMIRYVVETALTVVDDVVVVIGHEAEAVQKVLSPYPRLRFAVQEDQLGTGHAVVCAIPEVSSGTQDVVVLCGDTPLMRPTTVRSLIDQHRARESVLTLIATTFTEPFGYGRIVSDAHGNAIRIIEESDASESEKRIRTVNTGTYCINIAFLKKALAGLKNDNAQGEFYLTDVVERAYQDGKPAVLLEINDTIQVIGVNTREELAKAERFVQQGHKERGPKSS